MKLPPIQDTEAARAACFALVSAYVADPEDVDWSDIQLALAHALRALGLPPDFPETEHARENTEEIK